MGYQVIVPETIDSTPDRPCTLRTIGDAAELSELAMNVYDSDPGEQLPLAYHYHDDPEEAFYVLSGTLTVETPDGEYTVDAGEVFVAEPESLHRAYSAGTEESFSVLAIGTPLVNDAHPYEPDR